MNRKATLASFQFANITEQMLSLYGVEQRSVGSLLATVKVQLDVDGHRYCVARGVRLD